MLIYKILRPSECAAFIAAGASLGAPVDLSDGFIHFSTASQVAETAARHFAGEAGLWLLACDADSLGPALRWEKSRGGQDFPHLYRPLSVDDVQWMRPLPLVTTGHDFGVLV